MLELFAGPLSPKMTGKYRTLLNYFKRVTENSKNWIKYNWLCLLNSF